MLRSRGHTAAAEGIGSRLRMGAIQAPAIVGLTSHGWTEACESGTPHVLHVPLSLNSNGVNHTHTVWPKCGPHNVPSVTHRPCCRNAAAPFSTQPITVADTPPQVWYGSAVLRELGRHPHHPPPRTRMPTVILSQLVDSCG